MRHRLINAKAAIKIGTADMDTAAAQNIGTAIRATRTLWRQASNNEIRGAATKIDDQRQFLSHQRLFISQSRRNRFQLRLDVTKALRPGDGNEFALGASISLIVVIDEAHRPPQHHAVDLLADTLPFQISFGKGLYLSDEHADDRPHRHVLALNQRRFIDQLAAQYTLQRAQQPAFDTINISADGLASILDAVFFIIKENSTRQRDGGPLQRAQDLSPLEAKPKGRIRGSKIQSTISRLHQSTRLQPDSIATTLFQQRGIPFPRCPC